VVGEQNGMLMAGYQAMQVKRLQGRFEELRELSKFALERTPIAALRASWILVCALLGDIQEARAQLDVLATDDFAALQREAQWLTTGVLLAEACAALEDRKPAAVLYERFLPDDGYFAWGGPGLLCYGAFSRSLGQLATVAERLEDAGRHFEAALRDNERIGARPYLAATQRDYARLLLIRGHPGDRERATGLLEHALAAAEQLSNVVDRPHEGSQAAAFSSSVVASSPVTFTPSLNVAPSPAASNPRRASLAPLDT
jgi:tetratricopeptide (TPR) repeat protein